MEKKQYPDNFLFAMESFRPDDIVLVLLKKPKLLPRLPAKNPPRPQLSPRISTDGGAMPYKFELQHRENLRPENLRLCTLLMSPPRNRVPQRRHLPPPPVASDGARGIGGGADLGCTATAGEEGGTE